MAARKGTLILSILVVLIVLGYFALKAGRAPQFAGARPMAIELVLYRPDPAVQEVPLVQADIRKPADCASVFKLLQSAQSRSDHKCAAVGSMTIRYPDGAKDELELLPGHDVTRYEFRFGHSLYAIPRNRLYQVLRGAGVDTAKIPETEH